MKYPLQQVRAIKEKKLEEAQKHLKEQKEILLKEEEKLTSLEKERDKVKEHQMAKLTQLREQLDTGASSVKIQQSKQYLNIVSEELKKKESLVQGQMRHVERAKQQVELARKEMIKREHDLEKLRQHQKEWQHQEMKEEGRKEALQEDEIGSAMHTIRKRKKP